MLRSYTFLKKGVFLAISRSSPGLSGRSSQVPFLGRAWSYGDPSWDGMINEDGDGQVEICTCKRKRERY